MIKIYNIDRELECVLQNAFDISYDMRINQLWQAEFSLPFDDPKVAYCLPFAYAEIYDGANRVELFRIVSSETKKSNVKIITFECEHVLCTLRDTVLFGENVDTAASFSDILGFLITSQEEAFWEVNTVNVTGTYDYNFENVNMLSCLFDIIKNATGETMLTFDTTTFPWHLNFIVPSSTVVSEIRYNRNLNAITRSIDTTKMVTKIYPIGARDDLYDIGYVTIDAINSGEYFINASTIGDYPVKSAVFIDEGETIAANLKAKAEAFLETVKIPIVSYLVDVVDIYEITAESRDNLKTLGASVKIYDNDFGIITTRIIGISRNIDGRPGDVTIELSSQPVLTPRKTMFNIVAENVMKVINLSTKK